jgi:hypothetical protein
MSGPSRGAPGDARSVARATGPQPAAMASHGPAPSQPHPAAQQHSSEKEKKKS